MLNREFLKLPEYLLAESLGTRLKDSIPKAFFHKKPDSEKPLGEWNIVEVVCLNDTIECMINGIVQNKVTQCDPHSGKIGIQLEGTPFQLRNIWLTVLN